MITPPKGSAGVMSTMLSPAYHVASRNRTQVPQTSERQFDQVNISRESSGAEQFRQECVSRLVREVRTAHTASDIARIKAEVQSGTYQPDAVEIAAKLLMEGSARDQY